MLKKGTEGEGWGETYIERKPSPLKAKDEWPLGKERKPSCSMCWFVCVQTW